MTDRFVRIDNVYWTDFRACNSNDPPLIAHPGNAATPLDSTSDAAAPSSPSDERATLMAMLEKRLGGVLLDVLQGQAELRRTIELQATATAALALKASEAGWARVIEAVRADLIKQITPLRRALIVVPDCVLPPIPTHLGEGRLTHRSQGGLRSNLGAYFARVITAQSWWQDAYGDEPRGGLAYHVPD